MEIKNKKVSIIGAVRSGIGAAKLVKKLGGIPFVTDAGAKEKIADYLKSLDQENIAYETGGHTDQIYNCDFIVTSPGVPSDAPVLVKAKEKGIKIISEVELASQFCKGKIIAITGTNGKTTTTSLCAHLLNETGLKTYAAGNIGFAFSEIALDVKENEYVALEISSFQIDHIDRFKPYLSTILNITPDHLDRYEHSFEKYTQSKLNIAKNLDGSDYIILNADNKETPVNIGNDKVNKYYFSLASKPKSGAYLKNGKLYFVKNGAEEEICATLDISLKGEHNYANCMAVIIIARLLGVGIEKIKKALGSFPGVEHRLELVRVIDGVKYINDSKATNVDSVWYALRSFDTPIYLILGGKDKGNDYNQIKDLVLERVKKIYAIGSSADKVFNFFHSIIKTEIKDSLEDCVKAASLEARDGDVVLLSPACASFDMFKHYEHRGEVFKQAVNQL